MSRSSPRSSRSSWENRRPDRAPFGLNCDSRGLSCPSPSFSGDDMPDSAALKEMAQKLRRHSLTSTSEAGSGHPTTCMSCAEIMSVLYFNEIRFDPKNPKARNVDEFVLSKGHGAPILWAALKEAGAISDDLNTLRRIDSPLEGHPTPNSPWVRIATGSLGQGLSASVGIAIAKRVDKIPARVYCVLGDSESAEDAVD